jgi:hypothetical protein
MPKKIDPWILNFGIIILELNGRRGILVQTKLVFLFFKIYKKSPGINYKPRVSPLSYFFNGIVGFHVIVSIGIQK